MATTTPNYGWPVPTSTDLVKDGATAIEALGDAIDATVFGLPTAAFNLVIPTSVTKGASGTASVGANGVVTFSATESIQVNGAFTSAYTNYRMVMTYFGSSAADVLCQFSIGGTATATNYNYKMFYLTGTETNFNTTRFNALALKTSSGTAVADITNPETASISNIICSSFGMTGATDNSPYQLWGAQNSITQFDGIKFYPTGTSNFSGTITIYGYGN